MHKIMATSPTSENDLLALPRAAMYFEDIREIPAENFTLKETVDAMKAHVPDALNGLSRERLDAVTQQTLELAEAALQYEDGDGLNGMNVHQAAALRLYTAEFTGETTHLYSLVNLHLRTRHALPAFVPFIWLLLSALKKCPVFPGTLVYRGVNIEGEELTRLLSLYRPNSRNHWNGFTSTSPVVSVQERFLGEIVLEDENGREHRLKKGVMFVIQLRPGARSISKYSHFPDEEEILLPPNFTFEVVDSSSPVAGLHILQLRELETDNVLLDLNTTQPEEVNNSPIATQPEPSQGRLREMLKDTAESSASTEENIGGNVDSDIISRALQYGKQEWRRSKIMIVGEGLAGKSALANSIIGKPFENTESTVGINQLVCNVSYAVTGGGGGSVWSEYQKPEKELEAALANIIHNKKHEKKQEDKDSVANFLRQQKINGRLMTVGEVLVNEVFGDEYEDEKLEIDELMSQTIQNETQNELFFTVNEELVMRCLATAVETSNNLIISVFDYGGQSVFNVIHHLFLTRNGVYVVAFNMEWLLRPGSREFMECLSNLRFWLNSVIIHTYDAENCCTAPIMLVGTRKDTVGERAQHEAISTALYEAFSYSKCWPSVLENEEGVGVNGCKTLHFFPVDNTTGREDDGVRRLMAVVEASMDAAPYTHREVPLTWLKVLDALQGIGKPALQLQEVMRIGERQGMADAVEVEVFLRFLHEMGMVMWHDERSLRNVVILDPVAYFVTPATVVICCLKPDNSGKILHLKKMHRECQRRHHSQWLQLIQHGVLDDIMLEILWKDCSEDVAMLVALMVKFSLFVPLYDSGGDVSDAGVGNTGSSPSGNHRCYLIPALLPRVKSEEMDMLEQWADGPVMSCVLVFSAFADLEQRTTINRKDLAMYGFLPSGLFERVVGKAVAWSQATSRGGEFNVYNVSLFSSVAVLSYGRQRFRLMACPEANCIRVDIEGKNPLALHERLLEQVRKVLGECMKLLCCFSAVLYTDQQHSDAQPALDAFLGERSVRHFCVQQESTSFLIPVEQLRQVVRRKSVLNRPLGRKLLNEWEVRGRFGAWVHVYGLLPRYDMFLSYRWGPHDDEVVVGLFDAFTNYDVDVFLDKKRLKDGRQFDVDFVRALTSTTVVLPLVSADALERMKQHDPESVDNVLLEWVIAMECYNSGESSVKAIFPLTIGCRMEREDGSVEFSDLLQGDILKKLPSVVPRATIDQAVKCLSMCNKSHVVRPELREKPLSKILEELMKFQCFKAHESVHHRLVADAAERAMDVLTETAVMAGMNDEPAPLVVGPLV